jgi:hypothetical protein
MTTHYSSALSPSQLISWAQVAATEIMEDSKFNVGVYPVFVFSGLSGIAASTALSLELVRQESWKNKFGLIYVRKDGECSHGGDIESSTVFPAGYKKYGRSKFKPYPIFVDDFIDTGTTLKHCHSKTYGEDILGLRCKLKWPPEVTCLMSDRWNRWTTIKLRAPRK